jgi:hypothetical protein
VLRAIFDRFRLGRTSSGDHRQATRRQLRDRRREAERQIDEIARAAEAAILREALLRAHGRCPGRPYDPRTIDGEWR